MARLDWLRRGRERLTSGIASELALKWKAARRQGGNPDTGPQIRRLSAFPLPESKDVTSLSAVINRPPGAS